MFTYPPCSFLARSEPAWPFWLLQLGDIAIYDLEAESGEPAEGEGEVGQLTRHTRPALIFDAHNGRLMNPPQVVSDD